MRLAKGRPKSSEPLTRFNVMLDANSVNYLRELGNGNLSAGVRFAVKLLERQGAERLMASKTK